MPDKEAREEKRVLLDFTHSARFWAFWKSQVRSGKTLTRKGGNKGKKVTDKEEGKSKDSTSGPKS